MNVTGVLVDEVLGANREVKFLQGCMTESLLRVIDGDGIVTLLFADSLKLLERSPVLDDLSIVTRKVLSFENSPFSCVISLVFDQSMVEG